MQTIDYMMLMTLGLLVMGIGESVYNRYNLLRIPARIHVSGTRGKSSVSRLIAAGLKGAGISVAAKTTGTLARMILPDGREVPVFRPAGANIMEQSRIVRAAAEMRVNALVLECMALQPELHWISEKIFVRATHGVITNCRPDHLDVMGPETKDVALCLAGMIPVNGKLFTAEKDHLDILSKAAIDRGTRLVAVSDDDVASVTKEELSGFS
jgi:poly-gamma-glutamate synthase PgsB/CapB